MSRVFRAFKVKDATLEIIVTAKETKKLGEKIKEAAQILSQSVLNAALTGAGISVESGIPDFRSPGGLWERYDIMEYAGISAFRNNPEKVWKMLAEIGDTIKDAKPNPAHKGLCQLEQIGLLQTVITQNIDNLHQEGGSANVIEYHGNFKTLSCLSCLRTYGIKKVDGEMPPKCTCGQILKPDIIFFGEAIPPEALRDSHKLASSCGGLLVIGTSARVTPANTIPGIAKEAGAGIIEINVEPTHLTSLVTNIFLPGKAGEIVPKLVDAVKELVSH